MGSILEMLIVLVGAALLTVQGIKEDVAKKRVAMLQAEGQNQAVINTAISNYIVDQLSTLVPAGYSQTTATNVTGAAVPTLATLSALSNNKVAYKTGPFWGGQYQIALTIVPDVCSAAAGTCHIASKLYSSQPLLKAGTPDVAGAGVVAAAGGNQFGYSNNRTPGTVSGLGGQWSMANPVPGQKAASIVAINGFGADGNSPYYRRDGALALTGALSGGGQDANNLGNVSAKKLITPAGTNGVQLGSSNLYGDNVNTAIRQDGTVYIQNAAGTAGGSLNTGAAEVTQDLTVDQNGTFNGYVRIGGTGVPGAACPADAAVARNSQTWGALVLCSGGIWQAVGTGSLAAYDNAPCNAPGNVYTNATNRGYVCNKNYVMVPADRLVSNVLMDAQYRTVQNGTTIPIPSCTSGGSPWWRIIPQTVSTDYANHNPPLAGALYSMGYNGSWYVIINNIVADGSNSQVGDQLGLQAEVDTGCSFANN